MKNSFWLGLLISVIIALCLFLGYNLFFAKKDQVLVHNPSGQELKISINNQSYVLATQQRMLLDLMPGKHRLQYNFQGQGIDTIIQIFSKRALINPTLSNYYIFTRPYGVGKKRDSLFTSKHLEIDNKVYFGEIKRTNQLVIEGFSLNLNQDYPKLIKRNNKQENTRIKKVFSKEDFVQFYFKTYE